MWDLAEHALTAWLNFVCSCRYSQRETEIKADDNSSASVGFSLPATKRRKESEDPPHCDRTDGRQAKRLQVRVQAARKERRLHQVGANVSLAFSRVVMKEDSSGKRVLFTFCLRL
jgi:hypothetical protein